MRKILNLNILGIPIISWSVGSFFLLATMFMWLGSFFVDNFHHQLGIIEEDVTAEALGIWYPIGYVACAIQGLGIAIVLKWRNWPGVIQSAVTGLVVSVMLGAMVFSYQMIILPDHNVALFSIYASGLIASWTFGALIMGLLRPRFDNQQTEVEAA